jgi:hypothetical protein
MAVIESATLVVSALLLVVAWRLSADLQGIRDGVLTDIYRALVQQQFAEGRFDIWEKRSKHDGLDDHQKMGAPRHGCFVVWVWRDGEWKTRGLPGGVDRVAPPSYPGAFSGDLAKTWVSIQRQ